MLQNNKEKFINMETDNFIFILTNSACPEQYNIIDKSNKFIAYLNMRWGKLNVHPYLFDEKNKQYYIDYKKTLYTCDFTDEYLGVIPEKLKVKIFNEIDDTLSN